MAYEQSPVNVLKGQSTNKAAGLMHGDSVAHQNIKSGEKFKKSNQNVGEDGHYAGSRFHYADKKYDKSIRQMFEDSFKTARAAGAKTFDFHHSGVKDPKTGKYKFKGGTYTTETK